MTDVWSLGAHIAALADWMEQSPLGDGIAGSRYWWAVLEGTHLLSLSVSVGLIVLTDLRLLGLILRDVPAIDVVRQLRPYALAAFAITFASGFLVAWSEASSLIATALWPLKLTLVALGGLNALYFELYTARHEGKLQGVILPARARGAAIASLVIWGLVIICGRLLAYVRHG